MNDTKIETKAHPSEAELASFLDRTISPQDKGRVEHHIAGCNECLERVVSAHESVKAFGVSARKTDGKDNPMKNINVYLIFAIISFVLSFAIPQYFIQFLVATLLLGLKWIVDSKTTKMLVMIYDAWKKGGEKEAGRVLGHLNPASKKRF